jgi:hypothetical protein
MKIMIFEKIRHNHALLMILCCAAPLVGLLALSYLGLLGSWAFYALFLLCPLAHILMCRKGHGEHGEKNDRGKCH